MSKPSQIVVGANVARMLGLRPKPEMTPEQEQDTTRIIHEALDHAERAKRRGTTGIDMDAVAMMRRSHEEEQIAKLIFNPTSWTDPETADPLADLLALRDRVSPTWGAIESEWSAAAGKIYSQRPEPAPQQRERHARIVRPLSSAAFANPECTIGVDLEQSGERWRVRASIVEPAPSGRLSWMFGAYEGALEKYDRIVQHVGRMGLVILKGSTANPSVEWGKI